MRTPSGATAAAAAAPVTEPRYLIEIAFSTPLRISTGATVTWNSLTWTAVDCTVQGLTTNVGSAAQEGALIIQNLDLAIGTLVLSDGISGRAIRVWKFFGDSNPALADPVEVFNGVGGEAGDQGGDYVRITLEPAGSGVLYCPRTYITAENGFQFLPAQGQVVTWGGETVKLSLDGI